MRILFWSEAFPPRIGGVEILAAKFLVAMRARGYEFAIIAPHDPDASANDFHGSPIHRLPFQDVLESRDVDGFAALIQRLRQIKREFNPDLIHIFHIGAGLFFYLQTTAAPTAPELVTLHQHLPERQSQPDHLFGRVLRRATWVTTCSRAVLGVTRNQIPQLAARSSAIQNGLEFPSIEPTPLDFVSPQLLCVGRLVYQKGFDLALDAFAQVRKKFPNARLAIAGDGPLRDELDVRARDLGIEPAVTFLGWVEPERMLALMNTTTLVIVPSRAEPFGLVGLQAAQLGRPVVATRVGGLSELVADGETGVLVEKEDPVALANAIVELLQDSERTLEMSQPARTRALELFGWERFVSAYRSLYERLSAR